MIYSFQLLRFLAALLVILFHLKLILSGYKGVDIFFVLSGFVVYYSSITSNRKSPGYFFINRLTKIYLLYLISFVAVVIFKDLPITLELLPALLLLPGHASISGVSWSLSYELYFYCLLGAGLYFIKPPHNERLFRLLLICSTAVTLLNLTTFSVKGTVINFFLGQNLWEFMLGVFAARLCIAAPRAVDRNIAFIVMLVTGIALLTIDLTYNTPQSYLVYGPLTGVCLISIYYFEGQINLPAMTRYIFALLGDASYALYLFAPLVIYLYEPVGMIEQLFCIGLSVIVAAGLHIGIERRLLAGLRAWFYQWA